MQRKINKADNDTKEKLQAKIMEQDQRMAMYSRALGVMGAHYSGPQINEKKEGYNDRLDDSLGEKDGKESGKKQSYKDRRDESEAMEKKDGKGKFAGNKSSSQKKRPDFPDVDKDGNSKESITKAVKDLQAKCESYGIDFHEAVGAVAAATKVLGSAAAKGAAKTAAKSAATSAATTAGNRAGNAIGNIGSKQSSGVDEEVSITKDMVLEFLVGENYATNEVSAEAMFNHMSDEFLLEIEERIETLEEGKKDEAHEFGSSAYDQASAEEQREHNRKFKPSGGMNRRPKGAGKPRN